MKRLALLLLLGCSTPGEPPPPSKPPVLTTTCAPTHDAVGPACIPRFESCPNDTLPKLGGGCEIVGDPTMILPNGSIGPPCADPPAEAVFVDGTYAGVSDGTTARPYPTIGAAIAVAKTNVWIRDGVYTEDLIIDRPLTIEGPCSMKVTIKGVAAQSAVEVRAGATLQGVAVTGPRRGITFDGAKLATLARVHVHDTGDIGVAARNDSNITLRRVTVERASEAGIASAGGVAVIEQSIVRDIKNGDGVFEGDGIYAGGDNATKAAGTMTIARSSIERVTGGGISVQGANVSVEGTTVKTAAYGIGHKAFILGTPARIKVLRSVIEDTTAEGIIATQTALEVDSVTVRRARLGIAIFGPHVGFEPSVRRTTIERARGRGISVVEGAATLESIVVRGTEIDGGEGCGVCAAPSAKHLPTRLRGSAIVSIDNALGGLSLIETDAEISRALIARNGTLGVSVASGTAKLTEVIVRDTRPRADGARGDGILAAYQPGKKVSLTLEDALIEKNRNIGIAVFGDAQIRRTIVRDTTARPGGLFGLGIAAIPPLRDPRSSNLTIDNVLIERNISAGIFLGQSVLDLRASVVRDTATDAEGAFGDGVAITAGYRDPTNKTVVASRATIAAVFIERNARAGVSLMGSALSLIGSRLRCNSVDLDVEEIFDTVTRARNTIDLRDGGGNDCSCDPAVGRECRAQTTGLLPVAVGE